MKNRNLIAGRALSLKITVFTLTLVMSLSLATLGYGRPVVSLEAVGNASPTVGERLTIDVNVSNGVGIAQYGVLFVFDATALKYIGAADGNYLPDGGIWIAPILDTDGTYKLKRTLPGKTEIAETFTVGVDRLSVSSMFFNISTRGADTIPFPFLQGDDYWAIAPIGSTSPLPAQPTAGTLITFTFEVLQARPSTVGILDVNLYDVNDKRLDVDSRNDTLTVHAPDIASVDINSDGAINILDLVAVAQSVGQPVADTNIAADVNGDGQINILDLVFIAQNFGKL